MKLFVVALSTSRQLLLQNLNRGRDSSMWDAEADDRSIFYEVSDSRLMEEHPFLKADYPICGTFPSEC